MVGSLHLEHAASEANGIVIIPFEQFCFVFLQSVTSARSQKMCLASPQIGSDIGKSHRSEFCSLL